MLNKYNSSKESIAKNGISKVSSFFVGSIELEKIREVIFEYLKKYFLYESDNLSLDKLISSEMRDETVPDNILKEMRNEVLKIVNSFTLKKETREIFEKIIGHKNIDICDDFLDFRANMPNLKKIPTGWHQDVETPFVENKNYWKNFSLTCWISLNEAFRENSIELMPRADNSLNIYPQHYGRIGNIDYAKKKLSEIDKKLDEKNKYVVECKTDQCIFFDSFILHRTVPIKSNIPRFSIDIRYFDKTNIIKPKVKIHPKLYYFKFLKSNSYRTVRDSYFGKTTKYLRNFFFKKN